MINGIGKLWFEWYVFELVIYFVCFISFYMSLIVHEIINICYYVYVILNNFLPFQCKQNRL